MNTVGKFVQRFLQPITNATTRNAFIGQSNVKCNFAPVSTFSSALVNSIRKSWYSTLFTRCQEPRSLLALPPPISSMQVAGFKVKYQLKRRCKDCYFVVRQQRQYDLSQTKIRYVICQTHPRHKQMTPVKKPKYTWIITHACQSKIRPW